MQTTPDTPDPSTPEAHAQVPRAAMPVAPELIVLARNAPLPIDPQGTPQPIALRRTDDLPVLNAFWDVVQRIPTYARLIAAMSVDPDVPVAAKASLLAGGAYLVSPVDLIPGVIPVAGQIDDLYVVLTALQFATRHSPPPVADRHLAAQRIHPDQLDHDLGVIRRLVKVGARSAWHVGSKALSQMKRQGTRLVRTAEAAARSTLAQRGQKAS
jgi:uncharacterized membrane protein YkvA (DUF1232 family)